MFGAGSGQLPLLRRVTKPTPQDRKRKYPDTADDEDNESGSEEGTSTSPPSSGDGSFTDVLVESIPPEVPPRSASPTQPAHRSGGLEPIMLPIPPLRPPPHTPPIVHHHHFHQHQHATDGGVLPIPLHLQPQPAHQPLLPTLLERRRPPGTPLIEAGEGEYTYAQEQREQRYAQEQHYTQEQQHYHGLGEDMGEEAAAAMSTLAGEDGDGQYKPIPIPTPESRMREAARLHPEMIRAEPLPAWRCFGCRYQSMGGNGADRARNANNAHVAISDQQWKKLDSMMGGLVSGGMPEDAAAMGVYEYYERLRAQVNARRLPGEAELPPWDPATILSHWNGHLNDANIWWNGMMQETKEIRRMLTTSGLATQHSQTGQIAFDPTGLRAYKEIFTIQHALIKMLPPGKGIGKPDSPLSLEDMGAKIKPRGRSIYRSLRRQQALPGSINDG